MEEIKKAEKHFQNQNNHEEGCDAQMNVRHALRQVHARIFLCACSCDEDERPICAGCHSMCFNQVDPWFACEYNGCTYRPEYGSRLGILYML